MKASLLLSTAIFWQAYTSTATKIPFTDKRWKKLNPSHGNFSVEETTLKIDAGSATDWWHTAVGSEPESNVYRHSGPVYYIEVPEEKTHWTAGVWVDGVLKTLYQQATLFAGQAKDDGLEGGALGRWVKAGVEVDGTQQFVGSVVTDPFSDWAIFPSPKEISYEEDKVYLLANRTGSDIYLSYAFSSDIKGDKPTADELTLLRQINAVTVSKEGQSKQPWLVGAMVCGPQSNQTEGRFRDFDLSFY